jgi:spore maturation protein CgeB
VVHIDYRDPPRPFLPLDCLAYFKRSWVSSRKIGRYYVKVPKIWPAHFHPISYAIMDEFVHPAAVPRDIDVGCYLRPNQNNRALLLLQLFEWASKTNAHTSIGPVNTSERNVFDPDYLKTLARTRILVTCNPDQWEGDSRTWEALANRCLVFVDELFALRHHPLKHGEHLIYFQIGNEKDLTDKLDYYLRNEREARGIAENGHRFAMSHHRSPHRIDEILNTLEEGKRLTM